MASPPVPADDAVMNLLFKIRDKHHLPRLAEAEIACCFLDSKPFSKGRFNWGKVSKFKPVDKLWHRDHKRYDFVIMLCATAWETLLSDAQKEALLDLHLSCCSVDYEPVVEEVTVKGVVKKKKVVDDWGNVQYSQEPKRDKETGECKWKTFKLDLPIFSGNVQRYGVLFEELLDLKAAVNEEVRVVVPLNTVPLHEEDGETEE